MGFPRPPLVCSPTLYHIKWSTTGKLHSSLAPATFISLPGSDPIQCHCVFFCVVFVSKQPSSFHIRETRQFLSSRFSPVSLSYSNKDSSFTRQSPGRNKDEKGNVMPQGKLVQVNSHQSAMLQEKAAAKLISPQRSVRVSSKKQPRRMKSNIPGEYIVIFWNSLRH